LFGVLTVAFFRYFGIITTSLLGSYAMVRTLSVLIGGYPNEFDLYEHIKYFGNSGVDWRFYIYMAAIFIIGGGGMYF